jgi:hypothetical protein
MSIQAHLAALERRHRALEQQIDGAQTHVSGDDLKIAELRRCEMLVKDEIASLRQSLSEPASSVELSAKAMRKTAIRTARLKSSSWYESATRSIAISKGTPH